MLLRKLLLTSLTLLKLLQKATSQDNTYLDGGIRARYKISFLKNIQQWKKYVKYVTHTLTSGLLKIYDLNKYGRYNTRVHDKNSKTLGGQLS